jgi:CBS domain-containing protein
LKQVTVGEIMRAPLQRVSEALSLRELADSFASWLRPPALAVDLNGSAVGLVGIEQVRKIERSSWDTTRVRQAMVPLSPETSVTPQQPALAALRVMSESDHDNVVVMQGGQAVGTLGREELARYLQAKGE